MADLSSLKQRVELVDLRLKTAHGARERESAALMESWEQIRDRFVDQNAEIARLRDRISELEDARDELLQMVHGLLAAVEGGIERMSDESVPRIRTMATNLLAESTAQPSYAGDAIDSITLEPDTPTEILEPEPQQSEEGNFHNDLLEALEQSIETVRERDFAEEPDGLNGSPMTESGVVKETASPGIRDLVARIESAVGPEVLDVHPDRDDSESVEDLYDEGDELSRDLQEIEALRGELHGLRQRISSGAM